MNKLSVRGMLLTAAMVTTLAVAATPAHARLTPVTGTISATSRNSELRGTIGVRCPTSEFTGTINAIGTAISGSVAFSTSLSGPVVTCTALGGAVSALVTCTGRITIRLSGSDTRTRSASGTTGLDAGFNCKIVTSNGCVYDVGPQAPSGGISFTDSSQNFNVNITGLSVIRSAGGILCPPSTTSGTFTGDYRVSAGGPVLIS